MNSDVTLVLRPTRKSVQCLAIDQMGFNTILPQDASLREDWSYQLVAD